MRTLALLSAVSIASASADDWPRWMGENSEGVWRESGIRKDLPEEGASVAWRAPVGWGYSGPAVAGGLVYVPDYQRAAGDLVNSPGNPTKWEGKERLLCLDAATGETKWVFERECPYNLSYPGGPRTTPTVAGGLVYFLGATGHLAVLDAKTGELKWEKDFREDFGAPLPSWGFSGHPLVEGDTLYCLVGGKGSVAVAFDAKTGEVKWKALDSDKTGYCPPSMIEAGGVKQLVVWHPEAINGLDPASGKTYWSLPLKPGFGMSVMMPRKSGNLLFASGIGRVGGVVELDPDKPTAELGWKGKPKTALYACNSTPLLIDGVLYGSDIDSNNVIAASIEDGERYWESQEPLTSDFKGGRHGTAFLTYHEGNKQFWIVNESGDLILAEMDREGYTELGRQHVLEPTNEAFGRNVVWSTPAFADKAVFMRNDKEIVRVDLGEE